MRIKFNIKNKGILERIKKMEARGHSLEPLLLDISNDMQRETVNRFSTKKDPDGKKWQRLSENTIAAKRMLTKKGTRRTRGINNKLNVNASILTNTGRLRNSIKRESDSKGAYVSTNVVYAATHQYGVKDRVITPTLRRDPKHNKQFLYFYTAKGFVSKRKVKVTIPSRAFMGLSEKQVRKYNRKVFKYLMGY